VNNELVEAVARAMAEAWDNEGRVIDAAIAAIALIRPATLEEAAKVADWPYPASEGWGEEMAGRIAAAEDIRALKDKA
jgi:hypothetical protein